MRVDARKLGMAAALAWAAWYTVCALLVAVAPARTQAVFGYVMHYELTAARPIGWVSYLVGMLATSVWIGLFVASIGWCFNALVQGRESRLMAGRPAASHP
jgi:hypothetical protein